MNTIKQNTNTATLAGFISGWSDGQGNPVKPSNDKHLPLTEVVNVDFVLQTINGRTVSKETAYSALALDLWKISKYGTDSAALVAQLNLLEAGFLSSSHEMKTNSSDKSKKTASATMPLAGHVLTSMQFKRNTILESIDSLEDIKLIDKLLKLLPIDPDRLAAIEELASKEAAILAHKVKLAEWLRDVKVTSDKTLSGIIQDGIDTKELQNYVNLNFDVIVHRTPEKMDGFEVIAGYTSLFLTIKNVVEL